MMSNSFRIFKNIFTINMLLTVVVGYSQPALPQRSLTIAATQNLDFGKFYDSGSGGTISVSWQGIRTTTGGIVAPASSIVFPALIELKLCQGRSITITYPPTTTLYGSRGGSIILDVGPTEKGGNGAIFATEKNCNFITILRVGGTLHIPVNTTTGDYTGNFEITFEQQ